MSRTACISIDLDPLACYRRIYGGSGSEGKGVDDPVLRLAVPRFLELLERRGIRGTLFAVGAELGRAGPSVRETLRQAVAGGHEAANHSQTHPYGLYRLPPETVRQEIEACSRELHQVTGVAPTGFRSPGYTISDRLLDQLETAGFRYDSSVMASVPYYMVRAAAIAGMAVAGRPSGSAAGDPRVVLAPVRPYRPAPGDPYREGSTRSRCLRELPVSVVPRFGLPLVGSLLLLQGKRLNRAVLAVARAARLPLLNVELHGVDLLDPSELGPGMPRQPDLAIPLASKLAILGDFIDRLTGLYRMATLAEAADAAA